MLAYQLWEDMRCPKCGATDEQSVDEDHARLVEHQSGKCSDCYAIDKARAKYHKDNGHQGEQPCELCEKVYFYVADRLPLPASSAPKAKAVSRDDQKRSRQPRRQP